MCELHKSYSCTCGMGLEDEERAGGYWRHTLKRVRQREVHGAGKRAVRKQSGPDFLGAGRNRNWHSQCLILL